MKLKTINFLILIFILLQLVLPVALFAVEIAPRISDREIIEKLAILEVGLFWCCYYYRLNTQAFSNWWQP